MGTSTATNAEAFMGPINAAAMAWMDSSTDSDSKAWMGPSTTAAVKIWMNPTTASEA
jgi:hypothetical protein